VQGCVLDVGCVPSPCSLDASVAGFSELVLPPPCAVQGCNLTVACVLDAGRVPSPCSLDASVAGFAELVGATTAVAVQGCKFDCGLCPWASAVCAVAVLARRERRWRLYAGATTAVRGAGVQV
jgi:hypothetical protein